MPGHRAENETQQPAEGNTQQIENENAGDAAKEFAFEFQNGGKFRVSRSKVVGYGTDFLRKQFQAKSDEPFRFFYQLLEVAVEPSCRPSSTQNCNLRKVLRNDPCFGPGGQISDSNFVYKTGIVLFPA
ncbi:MAG: hypothetical protein IT269_08600 [Saprospiraceae bacterium]|nr:hypothetical protein [Saprospiraceae bacterium]